MSHHEKWKSFLADEMKSNIIKQIYFLTARMEVDMKMEKGNYRLLSASEQKHPSPLIFQQFSHAKQKPDEVIISSKYFLPFFQKNSSFVAFVSINAALKHLMPCSQFCLLTVYILTGFFFHLLLVGKGHFHQFSLIYDTSF